jgi:hypothetical protein
MDACKIKTILRWKIYGLWMQLLKHTKFLCFFPKKLGTIFAGKLISRTFIMGTPIR